MDIGHPHVTYNGDMTLSQMPHRAGVNERNLARLNPVLALNRLPANFSSWRRVINVDQAGPIQLTCTASGRHVKTLHDGTVIETPHVVPHGIDADIVFGLLTAFELAGRPDDRVLTVGLNELLKWCGLSAGGRVYARLRDSLLRLMNTSFHAESCWQNAKGKWNWVSSHFSILDEVHFLNEDEPDFPVTDSHRFTPKTMVNVVLGRTIALSMSMGHTRQVDLVFYSGLRSHVSRALYRTLEEQFALAGKDVYAVPLRVWGEHLGFLEMQGVHPQTGLADTQVYQPRKIRRALQTAHEELVEKGYLKNVDYAGKGRFQTVLYRRHVKQSNVNIETLGLLTSRGVTQGVALKLAQEHTHGEIEQACKLFDVRRQNGYQVKNPGGLLHDIIREPDKYLNSAPIPAPALSKPVKSHPAKPAPEGEAPQKSERLPSSFKLLFNNSPLKDTLEGREGLERLQEAYLKDHFSTMELIKLSNLEHREAHEQLGAMLSRIPT